jgi:hypothetical protein
VSFFLDVQRDGVEGDRLVVGVGRVTDAAGPANLITSFEEPILFLGEFGDALLDVFGIGHAKVRNVRLGVLHAGGHVIA